MTSYNKKTIIVFVGALATLLSACGHKSNTAQTAKVASAVLVHTDAENERISYAVERLARMKSASPTEIMAELALLSGYGDPKYLYSQLDEKLNLDCQSNKCTITRKTSP